MSGRFADPAAVDRLVLGPCGCPGTPHDEDWANLRTELSGADWLAIAQGGTSVALGIIVVDWNLCDAAGPVAPDTEHLANLDMATFTLIDGWVAKHLEFPALPNGSGAPSRNGSRASASHIRTIPTRR
jgi:hypothetical protein